MSLFLVSIDCTCPPSHVGPQNCPSCKELPVLAAPQHLQSEQSKISQPPFIWHMLQVLNRLHSPCLLQYVHVSLLLRSPALTRAQQRGRITSLVLLTSSRSVMKMLNTIGQVLTPGVLPETWVLISFGYPAELHVGLSPTALLTVWLCPEVHCWWLLLADNSQQREFTWQQWTGLVILGLICHLIQLHTKPEALCLVFTLINERVRDCSQDSTPTATAQLGLLSAKVTIQLYFPTAYSQASQTASKLSIRNELYPRLDLKSYPSPEAVVADPGQKPSKVCASNLSSVCGPIP